MNISGVQGDVNTGGARGRLPALGMLLSSLIPSCSPRRVCIRLRSHSQRRQGGQDQPPASAVGGPGAQAALSPAWLCDAQWDLQPPGAGAGLGPCPHTGWRGHGRKGSNGLLEKGFIMFHIPFVLRCGFIYGRGRK